MRRGLVLAVSGSVVVLFSGFAMVLGIYGIVEYPTLLLSYGLHGIEVAGGLTPVGWSEALENMRSPAALVPAFITLAGALMLVAGIRLIRKGRGGN